MVSKDLELKIKRVKEFMQLWIKFHDLYKDALSDGVITPEEESNFLETKSLIARKYQALKELLGKGSCCTNTDCMITTNDDSKFMLAEKMQNLIIYGLNKSFRCFFLQNWLSGPYAFKMDFRISFDIIKF